MARTIQTARKNCSSYHRKASDLSRAGPSHTKAGEASSNSPTPRAAGVAIEEREDVPQFIGPLPLEEHVWAELEEGKRQQLAKGEDDTDSRDYDDGTASQDEETEKEDEDDFDAEMTGYPSGASNRFADDYDEYAEEDYMYPPIEYPWEPEEVSNEGDGEADTEDNQVELVEEAAPREEDESEGGQPQQQVIPELVLEPQQVPELEMIEIEEEEEEEQPEPVQELEMHEVGEEEEEEEEEEDDPVPEPVVQAAPPAAEIAREEHFLSDSSDGSDSDDSMDSAISEDDFMPSPVALSQETYKGLMEELDSTRRDAREMRELLRDLPANRRKAQEQLQRQEERVRLAQEECDFWKRKYFEECRRNRARSNGAGPSQPPAHYHI